MFTENDSEILKISKPLKKININLVLMAFLKDIPILKRLIDTGYTILLVIILSAIVGLILAFPVKLLWNFVFGSLYKINWFQAWALNVLSSILLGHKVSSK